MDKRNSPLRSATWSSPSARGSVFIPPSFRSRLLASAQNRQINREQFLRGDWGGARGRPIRPPWSVEEAQFLENCDRCSACIERCPENILISERGFPRVDFSRGECTFCDECVDACETGALSKPAEESEPWKLTVSIADNCLAKNAVICRSCGEVCDERAISFTLRPGGVSIPEFDQAACSGCGACVRPCPVQAVAVKHFSPERAGINLSEEKIAI